MSQVDIRAAFTAKVVEWANAQSPVLHVVRENVSYDKTTATLPFLEVFLLPAPTVNRSVDGLHGTKRGVFQINIWVKRDGAVQGMGKLDRFADSLVSYFPVVPKTMLPISVEQIPSVTQPMDEDGWVVLPVSISFRCEV